MRIAFHAASQTFMEGRIAFARRRNGIPCVFYNAVQLAGKPRAFTQFVLYHEAAHFKLGHDYDPRDRAEAVAQEFDADALALFDLMATGQFGPHDLHIVQRVNREDARHDPYDGAGPMHPSATSRNLALERVYRDIVDGMRERRYPSRFPRSFDCL